MAVANLADIPARQCTVHGLAAGLAPFEMDFDKAHVDTKIRLLVLFAFWLFYLSASATFKVSDF